MKKAENKMMASSPSTKGEIFNFPAADGYEAVSIEAENLDEALKLLAKLRK